MGVGDLVEVWTGERRLKGEDQRMQTGVCVDWKTWTRGRGLKGVDQKVWTRVYRLESVDQRAQTGGCGLKGVN